MCDHRLHPKFEIECDHRVLHTGVISAFEIKRLLYKGCKAYLAHVVDKFSLEVTLENVTIVQKFSDVYLDDLSRLPPVLELELELNCCRVQLSFLYHRIGWRQLS